MQRARPWLMVAALLILLQPSCDIPEDCPLSIEPAILAEVRDSITGVPKADQARGIVRDGAYTDSLRPGGALGDGTLHRLLAALGRAGVYEVVVERPGYAVWQRSGVRVVDGECGVETVNVMVRLQPTP